MPSTSHDLPYDDLPTTRGPAPGVTQRIAQALADSGLNAQASLYDEALALAREGRLAPAAERLRMLLCLDPTDADAALLLAKVLAGREQWQEALGMLETAAANGASIPASLRDQIQSAFARQVDRDELRRAQAVNRDTDELRNLRAEAKRLRSDNANLEQAVGELRGRSRLYASAAAVAGGIALALGVSVVVLSLGDKDDTLAVEPIAAAAEVASAPTTVVVPPTPPAATPPEAQVAPAPAVEAGPTVHVVKRGDTLASIARRHYGRSSAWPRIQAANKDILGGGNALQIGMRLDIPRAE